MSYETQVLRFSGQSLILNELLSNTDSLNRFSNVSEIVYESESRRKTDLIPFTGIFQINKVNSSSVQSVLIEVEIPSLFNKQPLLYQPVINKPTNAHNRGVSVNCNQTVSVLPSLPVKSSDKTNNRFKRNINESEDKRKTLKLV